MTQHAALLDLERRKLVLLKERVLEQERRIQTLEAMTDDPLDEALERELAAAPRPPKTAPIKEAPKQEGGAVAAPSPLPTQATGMSFVWQRAPKRVPDTWVRLLRFIGTAGKTYTQVKAFIDKNELPLSHGAARTQLMNYRKEFGFVENPKKGFYVATQRALEFIRVQEEESPTVGDGGAQDPQPTPLVRAEA